MKRDIYDIETFPNLFTASFLPLDSEYVRAFEISERKDQRIELIDYVHSLDEMIGFNNVGFDWPILNKLLLNPSMSPYELHQIAEEIIGSNNRFGHIVWQPSVRQVDLYLVHHFDNRARSTSLKTLEFNMRMSDIQDMPFPVGVNVPLHGIDTVLTYNAHDCHATKLFYSKSLDKIKFREGFDPSWINYNDGKIGKSLFIQHLEAAGVECFRENSEGKRVPRQTPRSDGVRLVDVIFPWIAFKRPELQKALEEFKAATIYETKSAFKVSTVLDDMKIELGLGGIHGSVKWRKYTDGLIIDLDVTSYYPNIAIVHRLYPKHLGPKFCDIYDKVFKMRQRTKKGTPDNAALKLALNVPFGDSNNRYGPFFDPAYMLAITINGQLMVLMLAEMLADIPGLELIQINTDGVTFRLPYANAAPDIRDIWQSWEMTTGMELEEKIYRKLYIRDVNNYIGEFEDGSRKRKGAYEWKRDWHQNHSALVIPKGAEAVLMDGEDAEALVMLHGDPWDFMYRAKAGGETRINLGNGQVLKGTIRYYLSERGHTAIKVMSSGSTKLHAQGYTDPQGKRGAWHCSECSHTSKTKAALEQHISDCHASRLVIKQQYNGEPIDIDCRAYTSEIEKLTRGFV
jgi:hypothetical protein